MPYYFQCKGDVFKDGLLFEQTEVLKYHADLPSIAQEFSPTKMREVTPAIGDNAAAWQVFAEQ
ncbi:MAG: hypothetical protein DDT39_01603 [Firmicutes bacterium]|nr:hypothetical protein [candidate division NPL-UPA2 bacterium]